MNHSEGKNFLVDVLKIQPDDLDCLIQAPSLENSTIQAMMLDSEFDYFKSIYLDKERKMDFINEDVDHSIGNYIQHIQIRKGAELLFEGFNGVEHGTLSKLVNIPAWFKEKYIPDTCRRSSEW